MENVSAPSNLEVECLYVLGSRTMVSISSFLHLAKTSLGMVVVDAGAGAGRSCKTLAKAFSSRPFE